MYILKPVIHETIWGGNRLYQYTDERNRKIGHLYLANGHNGTSNIILNGVHQGKTLKDVFELKKSEWNMLHYDDFPLTIALVDAADDLSIQVHPDAIDAERLEGKKTGKEESWVFLEAPKNGWIYNGCKCTKIEEVRTAVNSHKMEEITNRLEIRSNDYVCIRPGTLHALTAGSFVYEIEFGSDYTYRFYDYNRKDSFGNSRELHIEKAMEAIKPNMGASVKRNIDDQWISEQMYEIRKTGHLTDYQNTSSELELITFLNADGILENCSIHGGMCLLLSPGETLRHIEINCAIIARLRTKNN